MDDDGLPRILPLIALPQHDILFPTMVMRLELGRIQSRGLLRMMENSDHGFIMCVPSDSHQQLVDTGCIATVFSVGHRGDFRVQGICRGQIQDIHSQDDQMMECTVKAVWTMARWENASRQLCLDFMTQLKLSILSWPTQYTMDTTFFLLCIIEATWEERMEILEMMESSSVLLRLQQMVTRQLQILDASNRLDYLELLLAKCHDLVAQESGWIPPDTRPILSFLQDHDYGSNSSLQVLFVQRNSRL